MPKYQLVSCHVNIAGDRNSVTVRDRTNPCTLGEVEILRLLHGGEEHVHTLIDVGEVERTSEEEFDRLEQRYGKMVKQLFPGPTGHRLLPVRDDNIPTEQDIAAIKEAANKVIDARKSRKKAAKAEAGPAEAGPAVPDLADLER